MAVCAVIDINTNTVTNIIVADVTVDKAPEGCFLVDVTGVFVDIGWVYDPIIKTLIPGA